MKNTLGCPLWSEEEGSKCSAKLKTKWEERLQFGNESFYPTQVEKSSSKWLPKQPPPIWWVASCSPTRFAMSWTPWWGIFGGGRRIRRGKWPGCLGRSYVPENLRAVWALRILELLTWPCWQNRVRGSLWIQTPCSIMSSKKNILQNPPLWKLNWGRICPMPGGALLRHEALLIEDYSEILEMVVRWIYGRIDGCQFLIPLRWWVQEAMIQS